MADELQEFYDAITDVINIACPEVTAGIGINQRFAGIWDAESADVIPWGQYEPPYISILVEHFPVAEGYSAVSDTRMPTVEVFYVSEIRGDTRNIQDALLRLRKAFLCADPEKLQVLKVGDMRWDNALEANRILANQKMSHRVGQLLVSIIVDLTYYRD